MAYDTVMQDASRGHSINANAHTSNNRAQGRDGGLDASTAFHPGNTMKARNGANKKSRPWDL
jgi:hypothetical protein